MRRGEYGYDAPYAIVLFAGVSAATAVAATVSWQDGEMHAAIRRTFVSVFFFAQVVSFLYTTRRGKFIEWARILDRLQLRGNERVLDMGCGRGAVLTAIAGRLTTGRVTGIDIWRTRDQSGNAKEATLRNAAREGVADRVAIETGDLRALPFPDATFDLVVSSLAIHNMGKSADRGKAAAEAFRVLEPGGRLIVTDLRGAATICENMLRKLGATNLERRRLGWRFWWGNPGAATTLLTASKPPA